MYFVLIIGITGLLVLVIHIFNKQVICPPVLVLLMFLLTSVLGLLRYNDWKLSEYGFYSVFLLLIALLFFVIGSIIGANAFKNPVITVETKPIRHDRLDLPILITLFLLALMGLTFLLFYKSINNIVSRLAFQHGSISETINSFRIISTHYQDRYIFPTYLKLLNYFCTACGTIGLFIIVHNVAFRRGKKKDLLYTGIVILWISILLLLSNRSGILSALSEGIVFLYFFWNMYYGWNTKINRKIVKWGTRVFILFLIVFVGLAVGLGRVSTVSDMDLLDYTTVYISSGIRNFDLFIKDPVAKHSFGIETFPSIYRTLNYRFGIGKANTNAWLEFRYINGLKTSNIYTCFRRYYSDFGLSGILILPFLMGFWFTMSYNKIKIYCFYDVISFRMLLFAYLSRALFYMPIDDTLFEFEFSINGIFKIFIIYILYSLFICTRSSVFRSGKMRIACSRY